MFQHLLVPLDGSKLAEAALPAAATLASLLHSKVTLVHLIEQNAPEEIHGERHLQGEEEACQYLNDIAQQVFSSEVEVECHVHTAKVEDVARSLVDHSSELGVDLIIMCTHGHGGLRAILAGSIAQQVVGFGTCPVLLIQPKPGQVQPPFDCSHILVPMDGDPEHEQSLPLASALTHACDADLTLLMVVHTQRTLPGEKAATHLFLPSASSALLELKQEEATEYLRQQVNKLEEQPAAVRILVRRGDPVEKIVLTAERMHSGLIILGTHGKRGTSAFWAGSITAKVLSRTSVPLLLVPVTKEKDEK